ncbi:ABC transporter permease [Paenibacillus swuensis]|uniref:ABC transporter permease n=1 Tax=Paenibacillus swuensis TaxID=1178515 RepID=UPI000B2AF033|nr:ABC transporter permease subunit [Paenibacillus swuensis]
MSSVVETTKERRLAALKKQRSSRWKQMKQDRYLYLMLLPTLLLVFFFSYLPMPGLVVAFMDWDIFDQFRSEWVGFANFERLFQVPAFSQAIWNTLWISILSLAVGFPVPIIFALLINEVRVKYFKRFVQTVSYLPHFLSWIAVVGILYTIFAKYGIVNDIRIAILGPDTERQLFLTDQSFFVPNVVLTSLWKEFGWGSIIYLAALTSIDPQLYEAATIDGAGKWRQVRHITLPGLLPTTVILLILSLGNLFNSNFELIYGLQNAFINFEVISTLVYRQGIAEGDYSMATALGFVQGLVAFLLIYLSNRLAKKLTDVSIW